MSEAVALEMIVGDLDDTLRTERLPGQVLARVPARGRAGQSLPGSLGGCRPLGPLRPGMSVQGMITERCQLIDEFGRRASVKLAVTPTWLSLPASSRSPRSSEPTIVPGPFLCQRKPATTQSAVRACLILIIARLPGR